MSHAGGQGLLSVALGHLPATFSSLVIFLEAVATAAFGWIILGERVTLIQGLGGALILAGIYVARPRNGVVPDERRRAPRDTLRRLFDAAVAAAHPSACVCRTCRRRRHAAG